jgi:hypothetical protein
MNGTLKRWVVGLATFKCAACLALSFLQMLLAEWSVAGNSASASAGWGLARLFMTDDNGKPV